VLKKYDEELHQTTTESNLQKKDSVKRHKILLHCSSCGLWVFCFMGDMQKGKLGKIKQRKTQVSCASCSWFVKIFFH